MQKANINHFAVAASILLMSGCASNQSAEKSGAQSTGSDNDMGQCLGVNACKGSSSCATANNDCAQQNTCKGKGWIPLAKTDCQSRSGKFKGFK